ncbi:MAG: GNAT family N-acetyltransferase [Chloroflexi bacterium]|nr:GNAT family N-acetyltransferase [Chloroflexota bacterium]
MEFANIEGIDQAINLARTAVSGDARAVTDLLRRVPYSHLHVDWRSPTDWLGSPGFVVLPEPEFSTEQRRSAAARLLPLKKRLQGCLAVAADPPPASWVRVASVAAADKPQTALAAMLAQVMDFLRETAVTELCWLATRDWPNKWLPDLGFVCANEIETYVKDDDLLPRETIVSPETAVPNLTIRPAQLEDMATLEQLEAAAFAPLWRYSAETLTLASRQALCFDTAVLDGRVVGFQLSSRVGKGAHLVRLTVEPGLHGRGIGSALLSRAINIYRQHDIRQISLNTQVDNIASQYLYRKFGFSASGQRFPVWTLTL